MIHQLRGRPAERAAVGLLLEFQSRTKPMNSMARFAMRPALCRHRGRVLYQEEQRHVGRWRLLSGQVTGRRQACLVSVASEVRRNGGTEVEVEGKGKVRCATTPALALGSGLAPGRRCCRCPTAPSAPSPAPRYWWIYRSECAVPANPARRRAPQIRSRTLLIAVVTAAYAREALERLYLISAAQG